MPSLLGLTDEERMKLRQQRTSGLFNLEGMRPLNPVNPEVTTMPLLPERPNIESPESVEVLQSQPAPYTGNKDIFGVPRNQASELAEVERGNMSRMSSLERARHGDPFAQFEMYYSPPSGQTSMSAKRYAKLEQEEKSKLADIITAGMASRAGVESARIGAQSREAEALLGRTAPETKERIGLISPDKFTPESIAKYQQTGNYGDLVPSKTEKPENITGQFITNKGVTVGFSDTGGAIAYIKDATGKIVTEPYDKLKHGQKVEKPIAQIDITNKLETEEAKEIGKARGEIYKKVVDASGNAETSNFSLDEFEQYLNQVITGKVVPAATNIAQWAQSFGVQIDPKWNAAQALDAVSKRFALSFRNPAGGSGMPGNFSDQDRKYLEAIAPGLGKSTETNRMIIDAMRKVNNRRIETQQMADDYYDVHGSMKGFSQYMHEYAEKNPLFKVGKKGGIQGNVTKSGNRFTIKETP